MYEKSVDMQFEKMYANPNEAFLGLIARYDNPNNTIFTLLYGTPTPTTRFLPFRTVRRPKQHDFYPFVLYANTDNVFLG